jgi:transposase
LSLDIPFTTVSDHVRRAKAAGLVMRQNHRAGEKLFVDFAGQRIPIHDRRSGDVVLDAELFVAVSGASSYLYAEALASQELMSWVTGHTHAFAFMGGCHEIVVCDNLRSGVTRPHRYEPDVNATYQEMATHYGMAVIPTRTSPISAGSSSKLPRSIFPTDNRERWQVEIITAVA